MWSTIAALKGVLRVRLSETKWRLFGVLKRVSTSEHGIAGHDRLALSVRSWSSCSIAAMRRLRRRASYVGPRPVGPGHGSQPGAQAGRRALIMGKAMLKNTQFETTVPRSTSMTLARRHRRGPGEPVSGLPPNGGFGRSLEDVSYGQYVKEPSRQVHVVATKSSTGNPGSRPSDPRQTSPPRTQFIAPGSLRRICGWQRASGAHYLYSPQISYIPHFVFRQRAQAVPGQNRSRNILHALDLHLHPMTSENVLSR